MSIGTDKWGNAQKILNEIEAERKSAEQAEKAKREAAEKAEKAKRESEERERKARAAKAEQDKKEAEERRQKSGEAWQYNLLAEDIKRRENNYVFAWVLFIGAWIFTIFSFDGLGFLALFFFLLSLAYFNYTDVAYNGGSKKTIIMSIIGCLELMIQIIVTAGFMNLILLPFLIGCIILSRIISAKRNPNSKESYLKFKGYDPEVYQTYKLLSNGEWICPSCGCKNASSDLYCKDCGKYK